MISVLAARPAHECHVRVEHVEPEHGVLDWRLEAQARKAAADGFRTSESELLLIGSDPEVAHVRDAAERAHLQALVAEGRRVRRWRVQAPRDSLVSRVQVAVYFDDEGRLRVASVGTNRVDLQSWGGSRAQLDRFPGKAVAQLSTLWLPLTEGTGGGNLRWRVALAWSGPDEWFTASESETDGSEEVVASLTGYEGGSQIEVSELQLNVFVERFQDWLSFPAGRHRPRLQPVLESRPGERPPAGRTVAAQRRDTRVERLEGVRRQLARQGFGGTADADFLRELVERGAVTPTDVVDYMEIDMSHLVDMGLLPR